jgi:hypothetical protein
VQEKVNSEQEGIVHAQLKRKEEYDKLRTKVDAIEQRNLLPECWTSAQLKTTLK